jgi:hypothetical protein
MAWGQFISWSAKDVEAAFLYANPFLLGSYGALPLLLL